MPNKVSVESKLDGLIEAVAQLSERVDEIVEKLQNMSVAGVDFEIEDYGDEN